MEFDRENPSLYGWRKVEGDKVKDTDSDNWSKTPKYGVPSEMLEPFLPVVFNDEIATFKPLQSTEWF
ncbi:hypothetical protein AB6A40_005842 [Gnathostoma spinigerum]|uniref:Uncharacterized protein n=1 Tax=Gnathostoma spinigerum TaxID=75299 RepID=A0ABD6EGM5_9BILA